MHAADATRTTAFSDDSIEEVDPVASSELEQMTKQVALIESFSQPFPCRNVVNPSWTERWIHMAKTRLQFDFTDEALGELDDLKSATGAPSRAEVIRQSLRLLQWTIEQTRDENATVLVERTAGSVR